MRNSMLVYGVMGTIQTECSLCGVYRQCLVLFDFNLISTFRSVFVLRRFSWIALGQVCAAV
jgi:hypothetical protein